MTFAIHASGAARVAIDETVPALVHDLVAVSYTHLTLPTTPYV